MIESFIIPQQRKFPVANVSLVEIDKNYCHPNFPSMGIFKFLALSLSSFILIIGSAWVQKALAISLCGILAVNSACTSEPYRQHHPIPQLPPILQGKLKTIITAQSQQPQEGAGQFAIAYGPVESEFYQGFTLGLQQSGELERIANNLNNLNLNLPANVPIVFAECGIENAFYNPEEKAIVICMDLNIALAKLFSANAPDTSLNKIMKQAGEVTVFIVYHEMGHALVDLLNLPITGKEEDAVDELAAILLLNKGDLKSEQSVFSAAMSFLLQGQEKMKNSNIPYWDEHSLDMQRFYSLICLIYGKNPEKYAQLVERKVLPEQRARRCGNEYAQKQDSWSRLLAPHVQTAAGGNVAPEPVSTPQPKPSPSPATTNPTTPTITKPEPGPLW